MSSTAHRFASAAAVALASAVAAPPGWAQTPPQGDPDALEAAAAAHSARQAALSAQAEALEAEMRALQSALVDAAGDRRTQERRASDAEARIEALQRRSRALALKQEADRAALTEAVAALQRLERRRPPALASGPEPVAAARAGAVIAAMGPALEARIADARADQRALESVLEALGAQRDVLNAAEAEISAQRAQTSRLVEEKRALSAALSAEARREADAAAAFARQAADLRDLIDRTARQARRDGGADLSTGFANLRGRLAPPAVGAVAAGFDVRGAGPRSKGQVIRTRPGALVTSPVDAVVGFAGVLRGYGRLLLLNVGDGYHIVIAGVEDLYVGSGQAVLAGEPLGEMPDVSRPAPELYWELREGAEPIDPGPWTAG